MKYFIPLCFIIFIFLNLGSAEANSLQNLKLSGIKTNTADLTGAMSYIARNPERSCLKQGLKGLRPKRKKKTKSARYVRGRYVLNLDLDWGKNHHCEYELDTIVLEIKVSDLVSRVLILPSGSDRYPDLSEASNGIVCRETESENNWMRLQCATKDSNSSDLRFSLTEDYESDTFDITVLDR